MPAGAHAGALRRAILLEAGNRQDATVGVEGCNLLADLDALVLHRADGQQLEIQAVVEHKIHTVKVQRRLQTLLEGIQVLSDLLQVLRACAEALPREVLELGILQQGDDVQVPSGEDALQLRRAPGRCEAADAEGVQRAALMEGESGDLTPHLCLRRVPDRHHCGILRAGGRAASAWLCVQPLSEAATDLGFVLVDVHDPFLALHLSDHGPVDLVRAADGLEVCPRAHPGGALAEAA
mmetsp:Transcript_108565/g.259173  ORF Transcript_108565/g.259173 Transcript_108565/m.259173 type:complete len:237 (+) Transcript_108565:919-1629(+)